MSDEQNQENDMEPITLFDAAAIANVTPEALRYAARVNHSLRAKKVGKVWFTTRAWIAEWKALQEYHRAGRPKKK